MKPARQGRASVPPPPWWGVGLALVVLGGVFWGIVRAVPAPKPKIKLATAAEPSSVATSRPAPALPAIASPSKAGTSPQASGQVVPAGVPASKPDVVSAMQPSDAPVVEEGSQAAPKDEQKVGQEPGGGEGEKAVENPTPGSGIGPGNGSGSSALAGQEIERVRRLRKLP